MDGSTCSQTHTTDVSGDAVSADATLSPAGLSGVLDLFREAASEEFFQQLRKELGLDSRRCIYDLPLVMWLMMSQRWDAKATLSTAVQQIVEKRPAALLGEHKRIREGTASVHTGATRGRRCRWRPPRRLPIACLSI